MSIQGVPGPLMPLKRLINRMSIGGNYAVVTQLGECVTEDHEVAGSSPAHGTISSTIDSRGPSHG